MQNEQNQVQGLTPQPKAELDILEDPYMEVEEDEKVRINADIPQRVKLLIQSVCPHRGILQAMVNLFIKSVADEMKDKNIIYYDEHTTYPQFIAIVRRRTASHLTGQGHQQDDGGGASKESHQPSNAPQIPRDLQSQVGSREQEQTKGKGKGGRATGTGRKG